MNNKLESFTALETKILKRVASGAWLSTVCFVAMLMLNSGFLLASISSVFVFGSILLGDYRGIIKAVIMLLAIIAFFACWVTRNPEAVEGLFGGMINIFKTKSS